MRVVPFQEVAPTHSKRSWHSSNETDATTTCLVGTNPPVSPSDQHQKVGALSFSQVESGRQGCATPLSDTAPTAVPLAGTRSIGHPGRWVPCKQVCCLDGKHRMPHACEPPTPPPTHTHSLECFKFGLQACPLDSGHAAVHGSTVVMLCLQASCELRRKQPTHAPSPGIVAFAS